MINRPIKHIHLDTCHSTQLWAKDELRGLITAHKNILVTAKQQTNAIGRRGNSWQSLKNGLSFSFTLSPSPCITLTPLEISVQLATFIEKRFNQHLRLKWPNDLMKNEKGKCGGVMINLVNNIAIVGVGLNLGEISENISLNYPIASILENYTLAEKEFKDIPKEIYHTILASRLTSKEVISKWNDLSLHMNKKVKIVDKGKINRGLFKGIGDQGEAILETTDQLCTKFYSGPLFLDKN